MLGVTVAADIYVLVLFSLTTAVAESECKGEGFSATALGITVAGERYLHARTLLFWEAPPRMRPSRVAQRRRHVVCFDFISATLLKRCGVVTKLANC